MNIIQNNPFPWPIILDWYEKNGRHHLPWRQYFHLSIKDLTYHVWLSEIMLQQTQVSRVIEYFEKILTVFPTTESLSRATFDDFFPYYKWLGYYSRARNMLSTAKIIAEQYNWIFPNDPKILSTLPWVGPYTAAAIQSFAYDEPILAVDTNINKIFARYYFGDKNIKIDQSLITHLQKDIQNSNISGRKINAALMDFASLISVQKSAIDWDTYPLKTCEFYKNHWEREIEKTTKKAIFPKKEARIIVVLHQNHKKYYAANSQNYTPFILSPAWEKDVRHFVQEYFNISYDLELSVRPIHDAFMKWTIPYIVCNAQIQTGKSPFKEYTKNDLNMFWKDFLK